MKIIHFHFHDAPWDESKVTRNKGKFAKKGTGSSSSGGKYTGPSKEEFNEMSPAERKQAVEALAKKGQQLPADFLEESKEITAAVKRQNGPVTQERLDKAPNYFETAGDVGGKGWIPGTPLKKDATFYHGTDMKYYEDIKKNGLVPLGEGKTTVTGMGTESYKGERGNSSFIAYDQNEAFDYVPGPKPGESTKPDGLIVEIRIPKGEVVKSDEGYYEEDEDNEANNFRVVGGIKPEWIVGYSKVDKDWNITPMKKSRK